MNSTIFKLALLVIGAIAIGLMVPSVYSQKTLRKIKYCKADVVIECANEGTAYFTSQQNGSGIPNSEEEMDQYCFTQIDFVPYCSKKWMKRCIANEAAREIVQKMGFDGFKDSMRPFCDPQGPIRKEFLKHSNCLIHHVKMSPSYRRNCIRPLIAGGEYMHEVTYNDSRNLNVDKLIKFAKGNCCAYLNWENCMTDHLTRNCGRPAADAFLVLANHGSMNAIGTYCPRDRFNPDNPAQCDKSFYLPPKDFVPKGVHSHSILSWSFSYGCPNVGWGIMPERDW